MDAMFTHPNCFKNILDERAKNPFFAGIRSIYKLSSREIFSEKHYLCADEIHSLHFRAT
ncbi:4654_t:CDS:2 [Ambispora leptoticha]|uniref:4654_t:CDS:1 n=1 Tax=Ambispora leptoticha TaxID=144679 RepID=A0A9N9G3D4_9GLOM|nr:4654_t:CDS:2 [Ambispora leptoticha]